jgi:hypothetical protein
MAINQEQFLSIFKKFNSGKEAFQDWLQELDFDLIRAQTEYVLSDIDNLAMPAVYKKAVRLYICFLEFFTPNTTPDDIERLFVEGRIDFKALMASSDIVRDPENNGEALVDKIQEYLATKQNDNDESEISREEDSEEDDDDYQDASSPIQSLLEPLDEFRAYAIMHYKVPFEDIWNVGGGSMVRVTEELVVLTSNQIIQS